MHFSSLIFDLERVPLNSMHNVAASYLSGRIPAKPEPGEGLEPIERP
jgi:hypothetical protein